MNSSSLIELYKFLTPADKKSLKKFVRSPFYNQREDVIALFDYLEKYADTEPLKLAKEKVFEAVYPNQLYNVDAMYFIMSALTQLINKFLTITEMESKETEKKLLLIEALKKRGAEKFTEKTLTEANQQLDKQKLRNAEYHYLKYKIRYTEFELNHWKKRNDDFEIQEMVDDFHLYAISEIFKLSYTAYSHKSISKKEYILPLLDSVLLIDNNYLIQPSVASRFFSYKLSVGDLQNKSDVGIFENLKNMVLNQPDYFDRNELQDLYRNCINYCVRKQNYGELSFVKEALDLYEDGLSKKILLEDETISALTYRNINMLALKINDFDFAEKFLLKYKQFLPEPERDNVFQYAMGVFYFRKGLPEKALNILMRINTRDTFISLDTRRLLARIFYELNQIKSLQSHIETSKVYLHRHKDMGYGKEAYTNFFKFLEAVLNSDIKTKAERAKIVENIKAAKLCAERDWLVTLIKV